MPPANYSRIMNVEGELITLDSLVLAYMRLGFEVDFTVRKVVEA